MAEKDPYHPMHYVDAVPITYGLIIPEPRPAPYSFVVFVDEDDISPEDEDGSFSEEDIRIFREQLTSTVEQPSE